MVKTSPPSPPTLTEVTTNTFVIGGDLESPYILGNNLNIVGLRVAVLRADKTEIPYADDETLDPQFEVYLTNPSFDVVLEDSFPFSLEVKEAVAANDYKLVLTKKPRSEKVAPSDTDFYGDLTITFKK